MSSQKRRAGQSTYDMADKRYRNRLWFLIGAFVLAMLIILVAYNSRSLGIGVFGFLGLLLAVRVLMNFVDVRDRSMKKEERRAIRGARAEEKVASILDGIGTDYSVLHDIPSPYGNIDHVLISKQGGVFLVETKAHGGRVSVINGQLLVNGHIPEKDFIAQALKNSYWLRDKVKSELNIEVWITPIVVFTNAFVERSAPIKGVRIINKKFLQSTLIAINAKANNTLLWQKQEELERVLLSEG